MIARRSGHVIRCLGETIVAVLPGASVGDGVRVRTSGGATLPADVTAVSRGRVWLAPGGATLGVAVGDRVEATGAEFEIRVGFSLLGRAIDACGVPLDDGPPLPPGNRACGPQTPAPGDRLPISVAFHTGIRALDALLVAGRGARLGIFGPPGAGKSSLLETIVAGADADAVVLALVGERGREAQRWLERIDARTTIVCATSDRSASERLRAADVAMSQAETLRARGLHVLLVIDSLARLVAANRERRTALREPVGRGGYPAGVWADLARYLERAGNDARGSITLFATVLSDGADERDPLSEAARSLLDGHIALSATLAGAGRFPAVDVLASASRTMSAVVDADHLREAARVRAALALLAETKDVRELGLGTSFDPDLAAAVAAEPHLEAFLRSSHPAPFASTRADLRAVAALVEDPCRSGLSSRSSEA